jgi:hypothetical protein
MNKLMMLLVVCTGFAATVPMSANALEPQVVSQNPYGETNLLIAQYPRDQDYNRDQDYRRNHHRDRQFSVYYRNYGVQDWTLEGHYTNRRDAQRVSNRLQRNGSRTYIQVSRRINSGMGRG